MSSSSSRRSQQPLTLALGALAIAAGTATAATYLASRFGLFNLRSGPSTSSSSLEDSLLQTKKIVPGEEPFYDTDEEREQIRKQEQRAAEQLDADTRAAQASSEGQQQLEVSQPANPDNLSANPRLWSDAKLRSWLGHRYITVPEEVSRSQLVNLVAGLQEA
ncbi:uncharacterized protein SAPINGB_P003518 [Magnusiomyces paraingens]|uniref:Uncharacterized protein n=1 Tax=Magnusiomyces paraingens TaxID=2606893 RepID=A0A5E8BS28_9ASCO|nr:uncharacterized protein SAPINGB_P003518 [Saprochaete ingens]VVT53329.1 unnamed protein product [Saprochaete ingens]